MCRGRSAEKEQDTRTRPQASALQRSIGKRSRVVVVSLVRAAQVRRNLDEFDRNRMWPIPGPNCADFYTSYPNAEFSPYLVDVARVVSILDQDFLSKLAEFGPRSVGMGPQLGEFGRLRPTLVIFGWLFSQIRSKPGQKWPIRGQSWAMTVEVAPKLADLVISTDFGLFSAEFCRDATNFAPVRLGLAGIG